MCDEAKRGDTRGTMTAWLTLGFLVLTAAGCARPDWIESTLVTVDVTGVWRGELTVGSSTTTLELTLQQSGPKVTGQLKHAVSSAASGPIEGTVTGDIFRFHTLRGTVTGELQVNGEEMAGRGTGITGQAMINLRRQP